MSNRKLRQASEWHEDHGTVLWWRFPICEPPYVGTPLDLGFTVSARLYDQFGDEIGMTHADVGGWPFGDDLDKQPELFWERIEIPETPDYHALDGDEA